MNLNFIYSAVVAMNFIATFDVSQQSKQEYFMLTGPNSTAHLFRKNETISLYLKYKNEEKIMVSEVQDSTFTFDWRFKTINKKPMNNNNNSTEFQFEFDTYNFLSPVLLEESILQPTAPIFQPDINYKLIALIIFAIGMGLKLDIIAPILVKILKKES